MSSNNTDHRPPTLRPWISNADEAFSRIAAAYLDGARDDDEATTRIRDLEYVLAALRQIGQDVLEIERRCENIRWGPMLLFSGEDLGSWMKDAVTASWRRRKLPEPIDPTDTPPPGPLSAVPPD